MLYVWSLESKLDVTCIPRSLILLTKLNAESHRVKSLVEMEHSLRLWCTVKCKIAVNLLLEKHALYLFLYIQNDQQIYKMQNN